MTQHESTVANSELWCKFLREQWSFWFDPFGLLVNSSTPDLLADRVAARIANLLTLVAFGPVAWLYQSSAVLDKAAPDPKTSEHSGQMR